MVKGLQTCVTHRRSASAFAVQGTTCAIFPETCRRCHGVVVFQNRCTHVRILTECQKSLARGARLSQYVQRQRFTGTCVNSATHSRDIPSASSLCAAAARVLYTYRCVARSRHPSCAPCRRRRVVVIVDTYRTTGVVGSTR